MYANINENIFYANSSSDLFAIQDEIFRNYKCYLQVPQLVKNC
jgi:hypothetical protein